MAFQPAPHTVELVLNWSGENDTHWKNVLNFTRESFDLPEMITLANDVATAVSTSALNLSLSDNVRLDSIEVIDIRTQGAPKVVRPTALEGTSPSDMLPPSVCAVLTLRTNLRGRSYRGRVYFAGFAESEMVDSLWIGDVATRVTAFWTLITVTAALVGWSPVVLSRVVNGIVRATAISNPVVDAYVRNNWPGSQRRRIPRR